MPGSHQIFILSDATGDTASRVVRAALKQFVGGDVAIKRFPNMLRQAEIRSVLKDARTQQTLVAHTFAASPLRAIVESECAALGIRSLDLLGPLLGTLQEFLHSKPQEKPGLLHQIDEGYFRRIDAVEFAVMHDDGKHTDGLRFADLVLVGLSRTGKTPLSVYLALEGWRVGNVPLIHERPIPQAVLDLPPDKVVGLVLDPRRLAEVRRARLEYMAPGSDIDYDNEDIVREEVQWSRRLLTRHGIRFIDVTEKAIEESAHQVLSLAAPNGKPPANGIRRLGKRA